MTEERDSGMSREEAIEMLKAGKIKEWNEYRTSHPDWTPDLGGADLGGADLGGADLGGADLGGADLSGADLGGADLTGANLRNENLSGANLGGPDLTGAKLRNANLSGANGEMSREEAIAMLKAGKVKEWNEYRTSHPDWTPDLGDANLTGAKLHHVDLSGVKLHNADLTGAKLHDANLSGAKLHNVDLSGATLNDANLSGASLTNVDLRGANLGHANLRGARLGHANLSEADLIRADLGGASLIEANLSGASLRGADFSEADLFGANLSEADLFRANLRGARLSGANLKNADARGCRHLRLDGQFIRDLKVSAFQREPYCVLRRTYTGPKQVLILLALVVFVLPFISKAFFWLSVNQGEALVRDAGARLNSYANEYMENGGEAAAAVQAVGQVLSDSPPGLSIDAEERRVWHILLAIDEQWWLVVLTSVVVMYSTVRAFVTIRMGQIREHEKVTGHAPLWREYRIFYWMHRSFLTPVFWIAMLSAAVSAWSILNTKVWIPA